MNVTFTENCPQMVKLRRLLNGNKATPIEVANAARRCRANSKRTGQTWEPLP